MTTSQELRVLLYSPANLNYVIGSSIWVQSVAETLHQDPRVHITIPLRAPETRGLVSRPIRRLERVDLIDPRRFGIVRPSGLSAPEALDAIEALDRERPFDAIILRAFGLCLAAADRRALDGRIWSAYILEPERDADSADYRADMARIARASRWVLAQSDEMRSLLESLVPETIGKTILLPPAVPANPTPLADPNRVVRRLIYTGKFHPFYQVDRLIEFYRALQGDHPDLEFHVVGDKIFRPEHDPDYPHRLRRALARTRGVHWHGALSRDRVNRLTGLRPIGPAAGDPWIAEAELWIEPLRDASGWPRLLQPTPTATSS